MLASTKRLRSSLQMQAYLEKCDDITGTQGVLFIYLDAFESISVIVFTREEIQGCIIVCVLEKKLKL